MTDTLLLLGDCETTGLDPRVDVILEFGWILCTPDLVELDRDEALVAPPAGADCAKVDGLMIDVVRQMHAQSGLWDEWCGACQSKVILSPNLVARDIVDRIDQVSPTATVYLAGSGVERFDKPMIDQHMPALSHRLHYASIDISSMRRFATEVGRVDLSPAGEKPHRGLADAEHALATMRAYRDRFFPARCPATLDRGDYDLVCDRGAHDGLTHHDPDSGDWWLSEADMRQAVQDGEVHPIAAFMASRFGGPMEESFGTAAVKP